ncbi:FMN-binding negative transcriptional regulator [Thalassoroseus pseudoceratinae]|uniref:FMN-binding negative transcriptional regulator n=1 Tax=Thalassoroseus pseudoceratinae TaxID=2713176 RepID=UPI001420A005|nr:FMN-binding negative transcriptional regulator [Thalassoroseus pseudoceratinae]
MYTPKAFAEPDQSRCFDHIEQHSFATLVSVHEGRPVASHLPFLLDREPKPHGQLLGHFARANSQWTEVDGQTVLAIFQGPHAYITPTWYESANVVPTWDYVTVHVTGTLRLIEDPAELHRLAGRTVDQYEQSRSVPWKYQGSPEFMEKLLGMIVGFRIDIEQIEGQWKLSQNHTVERRERVIHGLRAEDDPNAHAIAELIQATLEETDRTAK